MSAICCLSMWPLVVCVALSTLATTIRRYQTTSLLSLTILAQLYFMNTNRTDQIIQLGNLVADSHFDNPHRGRVYAIHGIAPTVYNYSGGGSLHAKILIEREL